MTTYFPPKKNTAFVTYVSLISQANTKVMQSNPTIASGDFKVSIDGGALANLTTLPSVTPASSKMVKIDLSSSEMNGDNITVVCSDAAGSEWCDLVLNLQTTARQIDDLMWPTVSGRSTDVSTTGEVGLDFDNIKAASAPTTLTNITVPTVTTTTTATNLTNAPTAGDFTAVMKTSLNAATPASVTGAVGSVAAGGITAASFAANALDAVWSTATRLLTAGTNIVLAKGTGVTGFNDLSAAQVNAEADTALADVGVTTTITGRIDAAISTRLASAGYTAPPTAAAVADQVWEEALTDHSGTSGSTAAALNAAGSAGDPWSTALPGAYGSGTAGKIVGDNLNAPIGSVPTANENADALLKRDWNSVSGEAARSVLNALRFLRNKWSVSGSTMTVTKEDDSTSAWTSALTTSSSADPVTGSDPT